MPWAQERCRPPAAHGILLTAVSVLLRPGGEFPSSAATGAGEVPRPHFAPTFAGSWSGWRNKCPVSFRSSDLGGRSSAPPFCCDLCGLLERFEEQVSRKRQVPDITSKVTESLSERCEKEILQLEKEYKVLEFKGDCVVTVLLAEEDKVEDDVVFYLVFSGSTLHHCTSTQKVSSDTLETIAPVLWENAREPDYWSSLSYEIPYGDCSVRHHRELDIYTLTSESESHHEPPFPGDTCSGHIFKLMNIQQQLMKTNLKQMDNLMPLMMTAQDPSSVPSVPETDGQFLLSPPVSSNSQQLSPPPKETVSTVCCQGSPVGPIENSCDFSSVVEGEKTDQSYSKKNKGVARKGEEVEPAPIMDSGTVSNQDSYIQSMPDCRVKGTAGLLSCGNQNEETGTKSCRMGTDEESLSFGGSVLQGDVVTELGTAQHFSGGELADSSTTESSASQGAGEVEHSLMNIAPATQNNMPQAVESIQERFEKSNINTTGATDVPVISEPVDKISVPNCVFATSAPSSDRPESSFGFSLGETPIEKTAETETSGNCEESADALDQNSLIIPTATNNKILDELEPSTSLADRCEAVLPLDLIFSEIEKDVMPNQGSEMNSSHTQSQNRKLLAYCATGDDKLCSDSEGQQNTVTSSGELIAKHCSDLVRPENTMKGQPKTQDPSTAVCLEDQQVNTITSECVDLCPLKVLNKKGQGKDSKLDTLLTNVLEVVSPLYPVVPKTEKELVPDQAVPSDSTFSLAASPGSESVTKDDALSLVPSQKEKGTATPEPHRASACRDGLAGGDLNDPDEQLPGDRAVGLFLPSAAVELQLSMGNTSPGRHDGELEGPGPSSAPEVLTNSSLLSVGKATLTSDSVFIEEGKNLVVPESSIVQRQDDKDKAVPCSSIKGDKLSSGTFQEEQRTLPPRQETPEFCEKPTLVACAEDKALLPSSSLGTPSACLKTETKHNKEVALHVSLVTEGGAAQSLVPPGANLATDSRQEALSAEQNSSPLLSGFLPDESEALDCTPPFALDVGVDNTESQGKTSVHELSGNVMVDVAMVNALRGTAGPRRKDRSPNMQNIPISEVLLSQEKNVIQSLPGDLPNKGMTGLQGATNLGMVPPDWKTGKQERPDHGYSMGDSKESQMDDGALQLIAKELPTQTGLSDLDDKAPTGMREVTQILAPGRERSDRMVSVEAAHVPEGADLLEATACLIVEAVIEGVKASGVLIPEGEISQLSPSGPDLGPRTEQLTGNPAGCFAGREEPEIGQPELATESENSGPCTAQRIGCRISAQASRLSFCHQADLVSAYLGEAAAPSRLLIQQPIPSMGNHVQRQQRETTVAQWK
uniref:A-kinase anchor protein 13-like n=1 Tax=Callospermophilus lateralis TaxID=76772 RepID=UPI004038A875